MSRLKTAAIEQNPRRIQNGNQGLDCGLGVCWSDPRDWTGAGTSESTGPRTGDSGNGNPRFWREFRSPESAVNAGSESRREEEGDSGQGFLAVSSSSSRGNAVQSTTRKSGDLNTRTAHPRTAGLRFSESGLPFQFKGLIGLRSPLSWGPQSGLVLGFLCPQFDPLGDTLVPPRFGSWRGTPSTQNSRTNESS